MERFDEERYANDNYDEETLGEINATLNDGESLSTFITSL